MVHQCTCKSLTDYMAHKAEVNKLSYIYKYCICDPECSHLLDPENWRTYLYCDSAEGTKQTVHLCYGFWVSTVFLDDFNGTFSACMCGLCPEILKFSSEKIVTLPRLVYWQHAVTGAMPHLFISLVHWKWA